MKHLWLALGFLTTIPAPAVEYQPGDLGRAAGWFPLVGLVLGSGLLLAHWTLRMLFPPLLAAVLLVALWAALTGGLHLDGLADCGDGLPVSAAPERRLEIMRDSGVGAFGVIALVLFLMLKVAAVAAQTTRWPLLLAPVLARWLLLPAARQPQARSGGLGADFAHGLAGRTVLFAALVPLAVLAVGGGRGLLAGVLAGVLAWGAWRLARARLGGLTGDVLGLTVELAELGVLLGGALAV